MAHARYRKAKVHILDPEFTLTSQSVIASAYGQFVWQMKLLGLTMWLSNKLDCDKWSWLFKAYITVRNALSRRKNAIPVGILCYNIDGDENYPHCINACIFMEGESWMIRELEPQPKGGLKDLTQEERDSAWLAVF